MFPFSAGRFYYFYYFRLQFLAVFCSKFFIIIILQSYSVEENPVANQLFMGTEI